jgi:hypothetical protein
VLRTASTTLTAGLANPVLSVLEDVGTLALFAIAVLLPTLIVVLLLVTGFFLLRRMTRRSQPVARTT